MSEGCSGATWSLAAFIEISVRWSPLRHLFSDSYVLFNYILGASPTDKELILDLITPWLICYWYHTICADVCLCDDSIVS